MKVCYSCNKEKSKSEFGKNKNRKDGLHSYCKECTRAKYKEYYKNNREKILKHDKIYREENKELISKIKKRYRDKNMDLLVEKNKEYRKLNGDKSREWNKNWHSKNKHKTDTYKASNAKYITFKDKLTDDEMSKLSDDGESLEVKCRYCGKYFIPTTVSVIYRINALNSYNKVNYLYCSDNCKDACPVHNQTKYPKGFKKASSREVDPLISQLCLESDGWECQKCGATQKEAQLHVHHIKSYSQNKMLGNDVENCITLCKNCHKEVHSKESCNYYELRCED